MRYEIDYLCDSTGTEKLVNAIKDLLPEEDTICIDLLNNDSMTDADVHLVLFSFLKESVPYKIVHALDSLRGKAVLLLVMVKADGDETYCSMIQNRIKPFLPDTCDLRGIHFCRCILPDSIMRAAQKQLELEPYNERAKRVCESYVQYKECPDEEDIGKVCDFVCSRLC